MEPDGTGGMVGMALGVVTGVGVIAGEGVITGVGVFTGVGVAPGVGGTIGVAVTPALGVTRGEGGTGEADTPGTGAEAVGAGLAEDPFGGTFTDGVRPEEPPPPPPQAAKSWAPKKMRAANRHRLQAVLDARIIVPLS